tara:strand:- start:1065 stop:1544 length:480 start_codon:yes stop_codon:yes gene_type:complete
MLFDDVTADFLASLLDRRSFVLRTCAEHNCSKGEAESLYETYHKPDFRVYESEDYRVMRYGLPMYGMIQLTIQNRDKSARHDWRDFQEIKNTLIGPEHEGAELYPAESRKHDIGNAFHMFVLEGERARFPFGASDRRVSNTAPSGHEQRPLPTYDPESK